VRHIFASMMLGLGGACGSGGGEFPLPNQDDPGTGSRTLAVTGSVEATEGFDNASDPNDFAVSIEVLVEKGGEPARGAAVYVTSRAATIELREADSGTYRGTQVGYDRVFRLDVDAGEDFVEGVVVVGPDIHRFSAPEQGTTVPGDEDLVIAWERESPAEIARLESRSLDARTIVDSGSFIFNHDDFDEDEERVRLRRSSRVSPEGAVSGSFTVQIRNQIQFFVDR
jgi:hypothetical protein